VFRETLIPAFDEIKNAIHLFVLALKGGDAGGELGKLGQAALDAGKFLKPLFDLFSEAKKEIILATAVIIGTVLVVAFLALAGAAAAAAIGVIAATWPILAIGAAIVGLGILIGLLIKNWDWLKEKTFEVWNLIPEPIQAFLKFFAEDVVTKIRGAIDVIIGIFEFWKTALNIIFALLEGDWDEAWKEIKKLGEIGAQLAVDAVKAIFGKLPEALFELGKKAGAKLLEGLMSIPGVSQALSIAGGAAGALGSAADFLGGFSPFSRQHGGPVWPGQAFMVGERGTELFMPNQHGTIIPNQGGGMSINFNAPVTIQASSRMEAEESAQVFGWGIMAAARARGYS
jgi:hypothetical protein